MTHQDQIIIICILAIISVPLGTFITIKTINKLSTPPVNTLIRSGDVELVDFIEPTRPQQIFNYPDLLESHGRFSYYYDRISDYGRLPSYRTGTPPIYQSVDRLNINCCLENNINLFDILIAFILGAFLFYIIKLLRSWYFENKENIVFTKGISRNEITFIKDYHKLLSSKIEKNLEYYIVYSYTYSHILIPSWTLSDIIEWLDSINKQDYAVTFELISKTPDNLLSNYPRIILSNEFIVNKDSNPVIISLLLSNQLRNVYDMFDSENKDNHYIVIKYTALTATI